MEKIEIIFVDDDKQFLDLIKSAFDIRGIKICCAESGEEALEIIKGNEIKIMVTDMTMKGINGLELTKKTKEIFPAMPIILVTGETISSELTSLAANLGISKILSKPVSVSTLINVVKDELIKNKK